MQQIKIQATGRPFSRCDHKSFCCGFFRLSTLDIMDRMVFCWGTCLNCVMSGHIPGFLPLEGIKYNTPPHPSPPQAMLALSISRYGPGSLEQVENQSFSVCFLPVDCLLTYHVLESPTPHCEKCRAFPKGPSTHP